jgi:bifunctional DNase/RNase
MDTAGTHAKRIPMEIRGLILDPMTDSPVVILHASESDDWFLPIWIGAAEANSIAMFLEGVKTPRPLTHNLVSSLLDACGWRVDSIDIHTLSDSVFYAEIHLVSQQGAKRSVDARPSDAIAIALRANASIYVSEEVLNEAKIPAASSEDALRLVLERLRPEDLGEYKM